MALDNYEQNLIKKDLAYIVLCLPESQFLHLKVGIIVIC